MKKGRPPLCYHCDASTGTMYFRKSCHGRLDKDDDADMAQIVVTVTRTIFSSVTSACKMVRLASKAKNTNSSPVLGSLPLVWNLKW